MKTKRAVRSGIPFLLASVFLLWGAVRADAQEERDITIRRIQSSVNNRTPEYTARTRGALRERTRDWGEIVVQYETRPDFIDELEFTYYAILKTRDPREPFVLLKGVITYVHVEKGAHVGTVYIHPSVLARFGAIDGLAVEIRAGGRLIGAEADGPSGRRYQQAVQQLPARDGHILPPSLTPFHMLGFDNNEMVKPVP